MWRWLCCCLGGNGGRQPSYWEIEEKESLQEKAKDELELAREAARAAFNAAEEGGEDATAPPRPTTRPGGAEEGGEDAAPPPPTATSGSGGAEDGEEEAFGLPQSPSN